MAARRPRLRPAVGARRGRGAVAFVERWSWAMGQPVHLQLYAESEARATTRRRPRSASFAGSRAALSLFDDASDLSELNRRAGRGPLAVGPDLAAVLAAAVRFGGRPAGAFDAAVEPLMRTWGFHAAASHRAQRGGAGRGAGGGAGGARSRWAAGGSRSPARATQLDLGGIGVGYGLDRAVEVLRRAGIRRALLDVSGDCLALGAPPGETRLAGGDGRPRPEGRGDGVSTRLRDAALATSSNLVSVVRYGRAVRGHVMDPETGWPAGEVSPGDGGGANRHRGGRALDGDAGRCRSVRGGASVVRALSDAQWPLLAVALSGAGTPAAVVSRTLSRERPATRARSRSSAVCLFCQSSEVCPP